MSGDSPGIGPGGEVVVYEAPDGEARVDVRFDRDTVWLTRQQMAELFGRDRSVVTRHIRNVFGEGELDPKTTCAKFAQVRSEGGRTVSREVDHYSLDVIISVGYRVKSLRGTQFRIWATRALRDDALGGHSRQRRADHVRRTALPQPGGEGGPPALLRRQGPPLHRRQQAHRRPPVPAWGEGQGEGSSQRLLHPARPHPVPPPQSGRGDPLTGVCGCGTRGGAGTTDRPTGVPSPCSGRGTG